MASPAPCQRYDDRPRFFWWKFDTLFFAYRGGTDPSEVYVSTDLPDALEQAGYDQQNPNGDVVNECPDLTWENF